MVTTEALRILTKVAGQYFPLIERKDFRVDREILLKYDSHISSITEEALSDFMKERESWLVRKWHHRLAKQPLWRHPVVLFLYFIVHKEAENAWLRPIWDAWPYYLNDLEDIASDLAINYDPII